MHFTLIRERCRPYTTTIRPIQRYIAAARKAGPITRVILDLSIESAQQIAFVNCGENVVYTPRMVLVAQDTVS